MKNQILRITDKVTCKNGYSVKIIVGYLRSGADPQSLTVLCC